ncbi:aprataxin [Galendromus occidentalis]|uniref:Aprataxin n=1 Tax=Galendromus occidentalis TaxID=34638 RepID=A0AAJ6VVK6_9ACAR|nr:aprataxin [Galendromus occidentalis]
MSGHMKRSMASQEYQGEVASPAKAKRPHKGLREAMKDEEVQVHVDDLCVAILDKYPKARHHFLVLPREDIPGLHDLTAAHVGLLRHLESVGYSIIEKRGLDKGDFRLGYHAIPSMIQLHLHVISQDFVSPRLETQRHWNSFTTDFFVESFKFIDDIAKNGKFTLLNREQAMDLLSTELRCHKCNFEPSNIPDLKQHLERNIHEFTEGE